MLASLIVQCAKFHAQIIALVDQTKMSLQFSEPFGRGD